MKTNEEIGKAKVLIIDNTSIITQNCDPYSFYWQIDKWNSKNKKSHLKKIRNDITEKNDQLNEKVFVFFINKLNLKIKKKINKIFLILIFTKISL